MTSDSETTGWYGGTLLYDQDESSECYKHYATLCQVNWQNFCFTGLVWTFQKHYHTPTPTSTATVGLGSVMFELGAHQISFAK